ncbi:metallophosphoesterase [bacterium]|nr:metallophosphoesterase [bacterium]
MKIFALSDLHLSFTQNKAMDVFGEKWRCHWQKIAESWRRLVCADDTVLVAGDISWGMRPQEAVEDLAWLSELPGRKILIRGNHDYWWQSIGKLRAAYPELTFVQNDAVMIEGVGICGSRGWALPGSPEYDAQDIKIFQREQLRLEMGLKAVPAEAKLKIAMMHYPPLNSPKQDSEFSLLLEKYKIDACIYGHLHNYSQPGQCFARNGINYYLTSADYLDFTPALIYGGEKLSDPQNM